MSDQQDRNNDFLESFQSESVRPAASNDIGNLDVDNLDIDNLDIDNLDIDNLDIDNLDIDNLDIDNTDIDNLDIDGATGPHARKPFLLRIFDLRQHLSRTVQRWVVPSALALVVGAVVGFWVLRTEKSAAPRRIANRAASPASSPSILLPSTRFTARHLRPLPPIWIPALPMSRGLAHSLEDSHPSVSRPVPQPRASNATDTPRLPPAASAANRTAAPPVKAADAAPPMTAVSPLGSEIVPVPAPAPSLEEPRSPAGVVDRGVLSADRDAVRRILEEYEDAFEDLDVGATALVWPSVDRRALGRAFATLKSQGLHFDTCDIVVSTSNATASCVGTVEFVRRVGRAAPMTSHQRWIFKMRKLGNEWMIEEVTASPRSNPEARARGNS